jgi:thioredoxin-dependent peroxiredoxin
LKPGDQVPDLEATLHDGSTVRLSELLEKGPVVLFFYPKAFTGGCTVEVCHFRDLAREFDELGAQRLGVSRDAVETQARFVDEHHLGFPLISDRDSRIARIFGAARIGPIPHRRRTVVIGTDHTLLGVIASETNMERHADDALDLLRKRLT